MVRLGILSDTHGYIDKPIFEFFKDCDLILHAGDFGSNDVALKLAEFKPLKAVYGNIDGNDLRLDYPLITRFNCEEIDILMTHIGGSPGKYSREILDIITKKPPKLMIAGHSHILKVIYDKKFDFLFINPGSAGLYGFHKVRTAIRLKVEGEKFSSLEILEIPRNQNSNLKGDNLSCL